MVLDDYRKLTEAELRERILTKKSQMQQRLVILGHHYQRDEVIEFADFRGDSFGLCQQAAQQTAAQFIVFSGVHFMAEAADIISRPDQIVQLPDLTAGCPLANFAELDDVQLAWQQLTEICGDTQITPITYINSSAEIKAFCGEHGGTVCTSSNALAAMQWGFQQSQRVLFFPDRHLGTNTANQLGIPKEQRIIWDPALPRGGNTIDQIEQARLILWNGYCHVHTWFNLNHIATIRNAFPTAKIVVHPECPEPVVNAADAAGSTSFIIKFVEQASTGSVIAIGTELNLVQRLAKTHPDKRIVPLARSLCPNMYKINLVNLCWTLEHLGEVNIVTVPELVKGYARIAIDRMLQIK
ncbi:MAG: quinolinate synthase NadA [candidate division KSB1 bacterium]|nr:quinolinate synthase NadA [candidate division KSB1 bacterium]MDZ7333930.1 quinolinate synthase NadA [candidate division KSB1 bacterium]MDZ7358614.1 quinolinate synthase NadA [candidate division KSB1 bacterium]MDZ7375673.1 quinolinate synthase NadA [candidate division KSB1 bacterium]MDZ7399176.1 quinolinate synthase NadA [candidate division KSB1 bacterium]